MWLCMCVCAMIYCGKPMKWTNPGATIPYLCVHITIFAVSFTLCSAYKSHCADKPLIPILKSRRWEESIFPDWITPYTNRVNRKAFETNETNIKMITLLSLTHEECRCICFILVLCNANTWASDKNRPTKQKQIVGEKKCIHSSKKRRLA